MGVLDGSEGSLIARPIWSCPGRILGASCIPVRRTSESLRVVLNHLWGSGVGAVLSFSDPLTGTKHLFLSCWQNCLEVAISGQNAFRALVEVSCPRPHPFPGAPKLKTEMEVERPYPLAPS